MKTIMILGANGGTARILTDRILNETNDNLILFLRNANRLAEYSDNTRVDLVDGDVLNTDNLAKSMQHADIIYSNVGGTNLAEQTKSILTAMSDSKKKRLIFISALGAHREVFGNFGEWNEQAVGNAIKKSGISRKDIFISSKVWIQDAGYDKTMKSFQKTLNNLQTDYLDLYLIHMPYGDYHGSWRAMEDLYKSGKIRAIGVCNFEANRLIDLVLSHDVIPAINQIETHPFWQEKKLRSVMNGYGITTMAWAPFAEGRQEIFSNPTLSNIGSNYHKTPAQVILRWLYQSNIVAIPKSVHLERIKQNFDVDDFELSNSDMIQIDNMDQEKPMILNIHDINEVYRLHGITFKQ